MDATEDYFAVFEAVLRLSAETIDWTYSKTFGKYESSFIDSIK